MKKGKKILTVCTMVLLGVSLFASSISAEIHGGTLTGGVKNRPAYYDPSVAKYGYTSYFDKARSYWSNPSNTVEIVRTTKAPSSTYLIDRYKVEAKDPNDKTTSGATQPMKKVGNVLVKANPDENWIYSTVVLYRESMNNMKFTSSEIQKTANHEVGHSIKMAHNPGGTYIKGHGYMNDTIMKQGRMSNPSSYIMYYDSAALSQKWGK